MRRDREAVLHFLAQLMRSLAGFGTTLFAAHYFGASGLGIYSQILALLFWIKLPGNSIKTAVSKRMSESEMRTGHLTAGILIVIVYGALAGGALLLAEGTVNDYLGDDATHLLVLLLITNMVFDLVKGGLVGRKRVATSGWLGTAEQIVRLVSQIGFVLAGAMLIGLVYGHIVSLFVFALVGLFLLRDRITFPSWKDVTELRTFAQYSWLGNLEGLALNWMDVLVLGFFVANAEVGIYKASWTLAAFLSLAAGSIATTLFPELSELGNKERFDHARELVSDGLLFTGVFLIPGLFGGMVLGERILRIYSAEFSTGGTILVILIGARTIHAYGRQLVSTLNGLDYPEAAFRINAIFFGTNLALNVGLVYVLSLYGLGWYGAAIATLTSSCVYLLISWHVLTGEIGSISVPGYEISLQISASAIMAVVLWINLPHLPNTLFISVSAVFVGAGIYGVIVLTLSRRIRKKVLTLVGVR